jgi:hypothetical protein
MTRWDLVTVAVNLLLAAFLIYLYSRRIAELEKKKEVRKLKRRTDALKAANERQKIMVSEEELTRQMIRSDIGSQQALVEALIAARAKEKP